MTLKQFRVSRRGLLAGIGLLLSVAILTSCSSRSTPSQTSNKPQKEMIVRMTQAWPVKLDPAMGYDNASSVAYANLYDTLVMVDPDGTIKPWVAKSWDYDATSKTYTFKLEKGIKFHNGDTLTAADVVFSAKRMLTIGGGWAFVFKNVIKDVVAEGEDTVKFILTGDYGPFLKTLVHLPILNQKQVMANIKKDGTYGEFGDYGKEWLVTHDAGSGPYMVKEMKTSEYLSAVRFPDYWKGVENGSPESFKIIGTTEAATVRTLMSRKELEITDEWQTAEAYSKLKELPGVKVADFVSGGLMIFHFNTSKKPLDDVHVRRALQYCFDYDSALKIFPGGKLTSGPVGSALPGYDASLPKFRQNLDKAREELKQSKYKDTIGNYEIELAWTAEVPDEEKVALLLQSNAEQLGIKIKVTKGPWLTWLDKVRKPETTPHIFTRVQTSISFPEAGAILDYFRSTARGQPTNCHWFADNVQKEIDTLVGDALATMDTNARYEKYKTITRKIVDLASDIWVVELPQRQAYQADYLIWPAAQAAEKGEPVNTLVGLRTYFRDMRLVPEKMP
ncbi:MAG TPA: ABC transporter substrate-binding protein [Firmicutes bacterium]|nr:ABC transporter substrate-binding protein [Bacillota bacterium]